MRILRQTVFAFLAVSLCLSAGCVSFRAKVESGSTPSEREMGLIKPGETTFSEILDRLGPPHYIIDGTQEMLDVEAMMASQGVMSGIVPTRTLTAPEGMVILIYQYYDVETGVKGIPMGIGASMHIDQKIKEGEIFIFLSKTDRVVGEIVVGTDLTDTE
jgi:hypothetical protein